MEKIAIITDSGCDLNKETLEQNQIHILPLRVIYNDREYLDKVTITPEELYHSLKTEHPSTSLPDMGYAEKLLTKLQEEGYTDLIFIAVSEALSGTLNCIRLLSENYPKLHFHLFDGKTVGFPIGAMALQISKLVKKGYSIETIHTLFPKIRDNTKGYIAVDTLEFLIKGGRISALKGTLGEVLHIKPIISSNNEGLLYPYTLVRGRKRSIAKLKEILLEHLANGPCKVWVLHGDAEVEAKKLIEDFKTLTGITHLSLEVIGAAMGVHTGPGVVGFCVFNEFSI